MKIYRVGGCVRDALLGLTVQDIDYVVVGSTPQQMVAAGYRPVGKDFPVFLHPDTKAEYALARTERKSAPGYHGFVFHCAPEVSIEEDLRRRDLTINAMAIAEDQNDRLTIIDPFGGQHDLSNHVFRHVSDAFIEDPVRILRVARFAARLPTFTIAPETLQLMRHMAQNGEVDALVPERVWQEIARAIMEQKPSRMIEVLRDSQALPHILPELDVALVQATFDAQDQERRMKQAVDYAAQLNYPLPVRWAAMLAATPMDVHAISQLCTRLKVSADVLALAKLARQELATVEQALTLSPQAVLSFLERCDAFRRPTRLQQLVQAVHCVHQPTSLAQQDYLERALAAAQNVPTAEIAKTTMERCPDQPQQIAMAIAAARVEVIRRICASIENLGLN